MASRRWAVFALALAVAAHAGAAGAAETGHGSMPGAHGGGNAEAHGAVKKGDRIYAGKLGPWIAEVRLVDTRAEMKKAMASGMKMEGAMKSHHVEVFLKDRATKAPVESGKGSVMVMGPDRKSARADMAAMAGHFGADVDLPKPGKYTFKVVIESGGKRGTATVNHTVK